MVGYFASDYMSKNLDWSGGRKYKYVYIHMNTQKMCTEVVAITG